jgi:DNA-binding response OmpR family regulator
MPKKVAIVEDDIAIAQMYRIKFEAEGYTVETAENGIIGLEMLDNFKPDILLLDLMMPEMNGDEMLMNLRKLEWAKDLPVIILTNMGESEAPDSLDDLNVDSYIVKAEMTPKQVAELVKAKV